MTKSVSHSVLPQDVVRGIAQIVSYHLVSVVSGDSQPHMSGDQRNRIPPVRRRHFDDGCAEAAKAILASGLVTVTHPDEAAIRADERELCARVAERTPLNSYDAGECRADIAAAIRAGGDING